MKSLLKLGSLFALIIAGRYMQLTSPEASAGLTKTPITLTIPTSFTSVTLTNFQPQTTPAIIPASERKQTQSAVAWF